MRALRILYEDEFMLAADKPAGFFSMPSEDKSLSHSFHWDALHILEKQKGQRLYPAHRLDRATSGLLLFSKQQSFNDALQRQFRERGVEKTYICVVRGRLEGEARIEAPLKNEQGSPVPALTRATALHHFSLPIAGPRGDSREFTFVQALPETGRFHQIRRHLASLSLPLVGDNQHGDRKVNRAFAELSGTNGLLLRCMGLALKHPATGAPFTLKARWSRDWHRVFDAVGFCPLP